MHGIVLLGSLSISVNTIGSSFFSQFAVMHNCGNILEPCLTLPSLSNWALPNVKCWMLGWCLFHLYFASNFDDEIHNFNKTVFLLF